MDPTHQFPEADEAAQTLMAFNNVTRIESLFDD
jgi:hypothetical protein